MKATTLLLFLICFSSALSAKTWTDTSGRSFKGELISQTENTVTILRESDQREYTIDKSILSATDRRALGRKSENSSNRIFKAISANELEYIDFMYSFLGCIILWGFGHLFAFQNWSFWRFICLNLLQAAVMVGLGVVLVLCMEFISQSDILLMIGIPICIFLLLQVSSLYLKAGLFRTFAYYFTSYFVIAIVMYLLIFFLAAIPY